MIVAYRAGAVARSLLAVACRAGTLCYHACRFRSLRSKLTVAEQRYAPEVEKRSAWYRSRLSFSWRVDETYVRVKGCWKYLYRAIDKDGATLDFLLRRPAQAKAAKRFLSAALPCGAAGTGSRG